MNRQILVGLVCVSVGFIVGVSWSVIPREDHSAEIKSLTQELKSEQEKTAALTHIVDIIQQERKDINDWLKTKK